MNGNNKLPLLPGFVINVNLFWIGFKNFKTKRKHFHFYLQKPKENHHLPHRWNYINGTNIIVENERKGKTMDSNTLVQTTNLFPNSSSNSPDWIAFDRKVSERINQ